MSNLTATNCDCGNNNSCGCGSSIFGGNSCIWIILLLVFCGGNGCGGGLFGGNSCGCGNNSCCEWLIWILLLSSICGNGCNDCGCGSSCC